MHSFTGGIMLSAQNAQGDVVAWEVNKSNAPFFCPKCKEEVSLKKGRVKVHHFSHRPMQTWCPAASYGAESDLHKQVKKDIYIALQNNPHVTKLKLERWLGEVRPDISFYLGTTPIAIEVQISTLSLDTIDKRTRAYANKGIYLLWISPYDVTLDEERYNPRAWEKYIHTMYFGFVYYWTEGETLVPVHFGEYKIHVKENSWWEGEGSDAEKVYAGGYDRFSKRYKTPIKSDKVKITKMSPIARKSWTSKTMSIPAAKLWTQSTI